MIESPPAVSFSRTKRERKSTAYPQRKQLILNLVHEFRRVRGIAPTYTEIAVGIGYSRTAGGTVHTLVGELIAEGWLAESQYSTSRNLYTLMPEDALFCEVTDPDLKRIAKLQKGLKILK